jgi:putative flavoprotein involved in K+ transport
VGRHARGPRRYRGKDLIDRLAESGSYDQTLDDVPHERDPAQSPSLVLSGVNGGEYLDLAMLARLGIVVTGRLRGFSGGYALFTGDLQTTVREVDDRASRMLARIDSRIAEARGFEPSAVRPMEPQILPRGPRLLDLEGGGVSTVIWATGYSRSYPWLNVDVMGDDGEIVHWRGVTAVPGLYALGLRFQHRRKSHFIGGVGDDARFLAVQMLKGCEESPSTCWAPADVPLELAS